MGSPLSLPSSIGPERSRPGAGQVCPKGERSEAQPDRSRPASRAQFALLHPERQLTLDGRAEPLPAPSSALPGPVPAPVPAGQGALFGPKQIELGSGGPGGAAPGLVVATSSQPNAEPAAAKKARPRYVPKSCDACAAEAWSLLSWKRSDPSKRRFFQFKCRNWRHNGECSRFITQRDYSRLREALRPHHVAHVLFLVLTYDPRTAPESLEDQYRQLQPRWQALERLLKRGWAGFPGVGKFDYATYVEGHRDGRPHLNVVIVSKALASYLRSRPPSASDLDPKASHKGQRAPKWFRDLAAHAGFGPLCSLRHARTKDSVASYVTKFAGSVDHPTLEGEVSKLSQLPVHAPQGFRRTRSSYRFLPPIKRTADADSTGCLSKKPLGQLEAEERKREAVAPEREELGMVVRPLRPEERGAGDEVHAPVVVRVPELRAPALPEPSAEVVPAAAAPEGHEGVRALPVERLLPALPPAARDALKAEHRAERKRREAATQPREPTPEETAAAAAFGEQLRERYRLSRARVRWTHFLAAGPPQHDLADATTGEVLAWAPTGAGATPGLQR